MLSVLVLVLVLVLALVLVLVLALARCGVHLMRSFVCDAIFRIQATDGSLGRPFIWRHDGAVGAQKCSVHNTRLTPLCTRPGLVCTRPPPLRWM